MGRNKTIPRRFTAPVASSLLAQAPVSPLHNAQRSADGEMVPNGSPGRQPVIGTEMKYPLVMADIAIENGYL